MKHYYGGTSSAQIDTAVYYCCTPFLLCCYWCGGTWEAVSTGDTLLLYATAVYVCMRPNQTSRKARSSTAGSLVGFLFPPFISSLLLLLLLTYDTTPAMFFFLL